MAVDGHRWWLARRRQRHLECEDDARLAHLQAHVAAWRQRHAQDPLADVVEVNLDVGSRRRRGLDILQRLQKVATLTIQIVEDDFPAVREVDLKLIELAKVYEGKIITNDFNLNKVAQLQGVEVLNINELANSLKPIVLPGETMRVFILKEGKEYNQGVAYLDDGTMVVVDNARKMIGKTIDVSVTSVLQTTAGKMIFGKWDERAAYSRQTVPVSSPAPPLPLTGSGPTPVPTATTLETKQGTS